MESRVISTGEKRLTESKELTSRSIEIQNLATSMTAMETMMDKRFGKLENWAKWMIGFAFGTVGLSIGTVRFPTNAPCF
jgi:hypothetical protein